MAHILVLLAEDEPHFRRYVEVCLVNAWHTVALAGGEREMLARIAERRPDALLMKPYPNCFEIISRPGRDPMTRDLPVILLTSMLPDREVPRRFLELDLDYVTRPFPPERLRMRIDWVARTGRLAPRVLVVRDESRVRWHLGEVLRRKGLRVDWAESGAETLERLARYRPDLVILDVMMPGLDVFAVLERLRADPANAELPVIMLTPPTADAEADVVPPRGRWHDHVWHFSKPVTDPELMELALRLLGP
jgi:CheY-like chemotaxis protein